MFSLKNKAKIHIVVELIKVLNKLQIIMCSGVFTATLKLIHTCTYPTNT